MDFFLFDKDKTKESVIEYHYLSHSKNYAVEQTDIGMNFYDSNGILENNELKDDSQEKFKESDFKRLINEKIQKTIYGEKYSNIVCLVGAGASVTPNLNLN